MNSKKSTKNSIYSIVSGFSLLEIVIAMLILSLVVAGMYGLFVTSYKNVIEGGYRLEAVTYARQVADALKVCVSADPNVPGPAAALTALPNKPYTDSGVTTAPAEAIPNATAQACNYTVADAPKGITGGKSARIIVTWTQE